MDMAFTKMSTKGQIVIPQEMRKGLPPGEKMLVVKSGDNFMLKPAKRLSKALEEDLEFAIRTEEAYRRHEKGDLIKMGWEDFIKEMKRW